ncbi:nucleotidyltransferase domain-containing protein [Peptoclostridium acidaminophilum]
MIIGMIQQKHIIKCNLSDAIIRDMEAIAKRYPIRKIVLFGSRARGDNRINSDIDIAIYTFSDFDCNNEGGFVSEIEDINTLLKFDIVFMNDVNDSKLISNINRDGVVIYERL